MTGDVKSRSSSQLSVTLTHTVNASSTARLD